MLRLGGSVITLSQINSSVVKGETIEDTIQTLCCYCDGIVMRHPTKGSLNDASKVCTKALINAGTQASYALVNHILSLTYNTHLPLYILKQVMESVSIPLKLSSMYTPSSLN